MVKINKVNIENDFARDVWCILGIPFDNYSMEDVCNVMDDRIAQGNQCVLSTPNLDWVSMSLRDSDFKKTIINSDVSVIDGTPIFWVSCLLGLPMKEKVPGSTLFGHILHNKRDKNYRLFFFGGQGDAAAQAFSAVNNMESKIRAVGYYNPGYGSIENMGKDDVIGKINEARPDILLVALGSKKGVSWIEKNKNKLSAKIISHLGATINFISGKVRRAPLWMQRIGIEWIWRIIEEPALWERYLKDGVTFIYLLVARVIPLSLYLLKNKKYALTKERPAIKTAEEGSSICMKINGVCNHVNDGTIRDHFKKLAGAEKDIVLDFTDTRYVDNSFLGLLLLLFKYQAMQQKKLSLVNVDRELAKIFKWNLLDDIMSIDEV